MVYLYLLCLELRPPSHDPPRALAFAALAAFQSQFLLRCSSYASWWIPPWRGRVATLWI